MPEMRTTAVKIITDLSEERRLATAHFSGFLNETDGQSEPPVTSLTCFCTLGV